MFGNALGNSIAETIGSGAQHPQVLQQADTKNSQYSLATGQPGIGLKLGGGAGLRYGEIRATGSDMAFESVPSNPGRAEAMTWETWNSGEKVYSETSVTKSTNQYPVYADPQTGIEIYAVASPTRIEARLLSDVVAGSGTTDSLSQAQASSQEYYRIAQDNAVRERNPLKYVGAHLGELAADVGYEFAMLGRGVYRLATDAQTQEQAWTALRYVANNPAVVVDATITGVQGFVNKPFSEQADAAFKFGLGGVATAGAGRVLGLAGDLTYQGATRAVDFLGSTPDNAIQRSMGGMGLMLRAVPEDGLVPGNAALRAEAALSIREARNLLRDAGVPLQARNEIIRSFNLETFRIERVTSERIAYRLFDDFNARLESRFVSNDFFLSQTDRIQNFALMKNSATRLGEVVIPDGSVVFTGRVAPQPNFGPGLTGGANQTFLTGPLSTYRYREIFLPRPGN